MFLSLPCLFRSNCWHARLYTTVLLCVSFVLPFVPGRSAQAVMLLAPEQQSSRADKGGRDSDGVGLPTLGQSVERELAGGQKHSYQITLAEGQYLSVVVEQRGINVAVRMVGTKGETITEWDRELTLQGRENAELVADTAGSYRVTIEAKPRMAASGFYRIRVMELRAATETDQTLAEARKLHWEGRRLYLAGKYDQALPLVEKALRIREKALGPNHLETALTLLVLGNIHQDKIEFGRAEEAYQRMVSVIETALGHEHPLLALGLNNLANTYERKYELEKSERLHQRALAIREKALGSEHLDVAQSLSNLSIVYSKKGDSAQVVLLLERSLAIREKLLGPQDIAMAIPLANLALEYRAKGDYPKAEAMLQRALVLREKEWGPNHPDVAIALGQLGELYRDRGDYVTAEPLYRRGLAIREAELGPDHLDVSKSLNSLGNLSEAAGDLIKAEQLYQRALVIIEKNLGPDHPYVSRSLMYLAGLYQKRGDDAKAEPLYQRALAIREKRLEPDHPDLAEVFHGLAELHRSKGNYDQAERLYQQALRIIEKGLGPDHPKLVAILSGLAKLHAAKREFGESVAHQARAMEVIEYNVDLNLTAGSERQKLAYLATLSDASDQAVSLHADFDPDNLAARQLAATAILRRKGRVQDAMADSLAGLRRRLGPEDQALLDRLNDTTSQLAQLVLNGPQHMAATDHQKRVKDLQEQRENIEAQISQGSSGSYGASRPITLDVVQSLIPRQAVLVEFAVYRPLDIKAKADQPIFGEPRYVVYIVRQQGEVQWVELGKAKVIDEAVAALRSALCDPKRRDVHELARAVDEKVMQPVRKRAGDASQLLFSPDGVLNLLPVAALVDEKGSYLIERYSISYLTSGRDLLRLQMARQSRNAPLVLADPVFGEPDGVQISKAEIPAKGRLTRDRLLRSVTTGSDLSEVYFARLEGTSQEAGAIRSLFPDSVVMTGTQATESTLKQAAAPRLVHIATHGFFLEANTPKAPQEADRRGINVNVRIENPLLRSGLALAGANLRSDTSDDGILTAMEAAGLNLWGTKLVTLSACDTGVGEVKNGEGVYGLRRAFVLAGAETLVMSLWPVSDEVTRELMTRYYEGLKQGQGRGEALRQMQLDMLKQKERQHPFYWASFIQSGEWANLDGKR